MLDTAKLLHKEIAQYLTVTQAAAALAVTPNTIYRLIYGNELPSVKVGRSVRISVDALNDYLARN